MLILKLRYFRNFAPKLTYYRKNVFHGDFEIAILSQFCTEIKIHRSFAQDCTEINILSQILPQKLTQN